MRMRAASIFSKFFLVIFANILLFFNLPIWLQIASYVYLCLLFFLARRWRQGLTWLAVSAVFVVGNACALLYPDNLWGHYLLFLFSGLGKMLPVIIVAALVFASTHVSELVYGLRSLHMPQWVVVPLSVLFRFFPTIRSDYHQIRNAMKFRGLAVGGTDLLFHPARSLEYIYVPLLNNASNVAADLTAAALTRGLANPGRKSSLYKVSWSLTDALVLLVGLVLLGCLAYA
ncbi:cobalt ABC transporter permease [Bombiscardovia nodaiensis]|uniref:Cobalt ABC transporter permease n=1 Tax=Bombiscardovia nodaiensis TaxID=2932181 RepID=A0ABN6SBA8_9BIFI|nr:cobalt ABC transporter permease [Bombiscardovia nodaiensis]